MDSASLPPLAVSLGDPAGIGPEVVAKCWDNRAAFGLPPFVAVGDARSIELVWDGRIEPIDDLRDADAAFDVGLPILHIPCSEVHPWRASTVGAHCSLDSLELAVGLAPQGPPAPSSPAVSKQQLYAIVFAHPGRPNSSPSAAAFPPPMSR